MTRKNTEKDRSRDTEKRSKRGRESKKDPPSAVGGLG
jgi:hypothetical protein